RSLHVGRHFQVGGGRSGLRVVGKAVGAGQIRRVAACKVKLVGGRNSVRSALVVTGIGDGGGDVVGFAVDDGVGIAVDGDHIVLGFQHIGFGAAVVIGSHILHVEGDGHIFRRAGFQDLGLGQADQVGGSFLNAAVGIGRVVIDFHNILAGH